MAIILSKKETEALLSTPKASTRTPVPVLFADEIANAKTGGSVFVSETEWQGLMKTTITNYYASKGYTIRKSKTGETSGEAKIEIKKVLNDGVKGWMLIKK